MIVPFDTLGHKASGLQGLSSGSFINRSVLVSQVFLDIFSGKKSKNRKYWEMWNRNCVFETSLILLTIFCVPDACFVDALFTTPRRSADSAVLSFLNAVLLGCRAAMTL